MPIGCGGGLVDGKLAMSKRSPPGMPSLVIKVGVEITFPMFVKVAGLIYCAVTIFVCVIIGAGNSIAACGSVKRI